MAVNESGNMTHELNNGITDGTVKKLAPNAGGDSTDFIHRYHAMSNLHSGLYDQQYGDYTTTYGDDDYGSPMDDWDDKVRLRDSSLERKVSNRIMRLR